MGLGTTCCQGVLLVFHFRSSRVRRRQPRDSKACSPCAVWTAVWMPEAAEAADGGVIAKNILSSNPVLKDWKTGVCARVSMCGG